MLIIILKLIAGIVLLFFGADYFVKGSASLARKMGISSLVIGLTVVALGTSAPELLVSIKSAFSGFPGIAVGNVVGSNVLNISLVLGICAMIVPLAVSLHVVKYDTPAMVFISSVATFFLWDKQITRFEAIGLLTLFVAYLTTRGIMAFKESKEGKEVDVEEVETTHNVALILLFIGGGLTALLFGANFLVDSGSKLARMFGVSDTIIGITIIALGTSLPELATSIMAALKKEADMAIGNVVGSNVFNIGLVLGTAGVVSPFTVPELQIADIGVMIFLAALLLPFLKTGFILNRIEGGILFLIYIGYMIFLWV